jgi:hypothetical protein
MTRRCHPDLLHLVQAAAVDSPGSFSVLGRKVVPGADQLLRALESELYYRLYSVSAEPHAPLTEDPAEMLAFLAALSRANTGAGTWEPGWTIGSAPDGSIITAVRDGVVFRVAREHVRTASGSLAPGERCSVRIPKEMRHIMFRFYLALGDAHPRDGDPAQAALVRLYWHLTPAAAIRYIREATGRLNGAGIPFQTKVVSNPRHYDRRDSGVLYLRRVDFDRAAPALKEIYQTVRDGLLPEVPLFTKRLAPGLGLAEDPGNGMSFGQSRCRKAAQGLLQGYEQGLTDSDQRLAAVAAAFRAEGIDPEYPYLEPGSPDRYAIPELA